MADGRIEEILGRLEALEMRHESGGGGRGPAPPPPRDDGGPPGPPGLGAGFDEKRVIDLLVRLVTEQVDHLLERRLAEIRIDERHLAKVIAEEVDRQIGEAAERFGERYLATTGKPDDGKKKKKKKK
jgi:hypothetical protein